MAEVMAQVSARIDQSAPNYGTNVPATCFGLPGNAGLKASYCNVHLQITCKAMDNGHLYLDCSGTIDQKVVASPGYSYTFGCRSQSWSWSGGSSRPPGYIAIQDGSVDVSADGTPGGRGQFQININKSNIDMGSLESWGASITGNDGVIWFSGTGTYEVQDPTWPVPVAITVPGFIKLFDYFPFAVRKGSAWKSCNRTGGGSYVMKSGSWRELKNSREGGSRADATFRSGGSWKTTPLTGEETV